MRSLQPDPQSSVERGLGASTRKSREDPQHDLGAGTTVDPNLQGAAEGSNMQPCVSSAQASSTTGTPQTTPADGT